MQNLADFKSLLHKPAKVVITTHKKPDADALGSSLALALYLSKLDHSVSVITPTDYPRFLNWMKGNNQVINFENKNEEISKQLINEAEIIFCLDFSSLNRINGLGEMVSKSDAKKVLVDHHLDPENFADFMEWDTKASATAELLFDLIVSIGDRDLIDKDIADCLYAGIMTDTGSFRHPNTTQNVLRIAADLVSIGADVAMVAKLIYDTNSIERLKFLGFSLSERLKMLKEFNTAYIAISKQDLKSFKSKTGDTEGLVNYALSIEGIRFAALIIDREDEISLSFRSIGDFSVNDFAKKNFDGGGHMNAAGGRSKLSLDDTVKKFENLLSEYKGQLTKTKEKVNA
jgi:bifunctional oligoribonuclease and PAP phosphatase NrnA